MRNVQNNSPNNTVSYPGKRLSYNDTNNVYLNLTSVSVCTVRSLIYVTVYEKINLGIKKP